jgi:aromatic-L-amino-acid/L-tryptophan decarboxylase
MSLLEPSLEAQRSVLETAAELAVSHAERAAEVAVSPRVSAAELRMRLDQLDPEAPMDPTAAIGWCASFLDDSMVHTTSPRYFGLFNPSPSLMGIVGDLLAAAYNPQLAAWSHAPGPVEMEAWLIRYLGDRIGFAGQVGGSFTNGGSEANAMAFHLALTRAFPDFGSKGLRAVDADPGFYVSTESHHAWVKIAHSCGVGRDAIRHIPVRSDLKLDTTVLRETLAADVGNGIRPTLIAATAGTTSAGVIDDLPGIRSIATDHDAFFHVDAAWGGSAVLSDNLRPHLAGIQTADSVTVDAHKWMSVPMGAGMFITPHAGLLDETYRISTAYMPDAVADTIDPYTTSNQWSRRFMGLKLFLTLITVGRTGYQCQLDHDVALGAYLRQSLTAEGWQPINDTPLPVVCFIDPASPTHIAHQEIVDRVIATGRAWISTTTVNGRSAIRACITSHRTTRDDVDELVDLLRVARRRETSS